MNQAVPELLPCPFCGGGEQKWKPQWSQGKKGSCQLHGEPFQAVILRCANPKCFVRPSIEGGDIFNGGEAKAREEVRRKWNYRAAQPSICDCHPYEYEQCRKCDGMIYREAQITSNSPHPPTPNHAELEAAIADVQFAYDLEEDALITDDNYDFDDKSRIGSYQRNLFRVLQAARAYAAQSDGAVAPVGSGSHPSVTDKVAALPEGEAQPPQVDGWLPINDEAKKQGMILLYFEGIVCQGMWFDDLVDKEGNPAAPCWVMGWDWKSPLQYIIPTHYMPLPQPPNAASMKGEM